jgi:hypothetical protein
VFTVNPTSSSNLTALSEQPRTPEQVAEENSVQVKQLPQPILTAADLPSNAQPGMLFTSKANPTAIYVLGYDNIWRAWSLLPVV